MPRTGHTVRLSVALLGVASALVTQTQTRPRHVVSATAAFAAPWKLIPAGSNRAHICSFFALRPFLTSALLSASVVSVCNMRTRRGGVGTKVNRQIGTKVPTPALALRGRKASHSDPAPDGVEVSEKSVSKLDEVESATLLLWPTPKVRNLLVVRILRVGYVRRAEWRACVLTVTCLRFRDRRSDGVQARLRTMKRRHPRVQEVHGRVSSGKKEVPKLPAPDRVILRKPKATAVAPRA